jgi:hypothetical protein
VRRLKAVLGVLLLVAAVAGCAMRPAGAPGGVSQRDLERHAVLRATVVAPSVADRILALDPDRVTDGDVRTILAAGPTPRIICVHGGIYPVHLVMESFTQFLVGMGYPEAKIRHPGDGRLSHSPYESSARIAGVLAWYYEREATMPMMIGHSQGGIQAVKVLYELDGAFGDHVQVWDPMTDSAEDRVTIVDPFTARPRPVVGLRVGYVSVVAAGGAALLLPNQWSMAGRLRTIPDTVDEFTGYALGVDMIAWDFSGSASDFRAIGKAQVRNVRLPASYAHVTVAATSHLARSSAMREWLNAYRPGQVDGVPVGEGSTENALWAADVWFHIKKHWALEAQRVIRAKRALPPN